jgi:NADH-quinone oxidoreductase subunit L
MFQALFLVPAIPLAGFVALALLGSRLTARQTAAIGAGSIGCSAVVAIILSAAFLVSPPPGGSYTQVLWTWFVVDGFAPQMGLYLDALSVVMMAVVTFVAFFIHLYSAEFMEGDDGYARFFAYMNLFVGSMIILVLANNLLFLFLGWEGVGLCSYLLIGFWYRDPANGAAGRKAFIVTRVGDTAFTVGLLLLFWQLGTLNIQELTARAAVQWPAGAGVAIAAAALLLGGAIGKSAQLPLQTWLPDAMAGPTPTSALIHAATMVTAGVYLIARTHVLFELAPPVEAAVAAVGAATLLLAGFSALVQDDIKRVLAYSTISQIGYMFLGLGVGAWGAAIFHFYTHAFFKALLFLAAGLVINALHHEHNIFRMGGLRTRLPIAYWAFLAGGSALAGLPLITSGFYSKDLILWHAWSSPIGGPGLWIAGNIGVLLTSIYTFRLIFIVFYGEARTEVTKRPGFAMSIPVIVLAILSVVAGFVNIPPSLGNFRFFTRFVDTAVPPAREIERGWLTESYSEITSGLLFIAGFYIAYIFYVRRPGWAAAWKKNAVGDALHRWWHADWGFDWIYDRVFVQPVLWFARIDRRDAIDFFYTGLARAAQFAWFGLSELESGRIRWYAASIAVGTIVFVFIALMT